MRKGATIALAALALGAMIGVGRGAGLQRFEEIERGRYLAHAADCGSCHTVAGSNQPFAGGRVIETPFGNLVSPNITPDRDTGIGAWTDEEFDAAVRRGRARDRARLLSSDAVSLLRTHVARGREGHPRVSLHYRARA